MILYYREHSWHQQHRTKQNRNDVGGDDANAPALQMSVVRDADAIAPELKLSVVAVAFESANLMARKWSIRTESLL